MLLTKFSLYSNSFFFIAVAGLLNSLKPSLPIEISNLNDPVNKVSSMQMNMWTMIVRPNILSPDIIVNASSQSEFLHQLEALFVYVLLIIDWYKEVVKATNNLGFQSRTRLFEFGLGTP